MFINEVEEESFMLKNFDALVAAVQSNPTKRVIAVAAADDSAVIDAVLHAKKAGLA